MQLESVRLKGIGPYRTEIFVDIAGLTGKLTAITGENGVGKTVFGEAGFAGAIFRKTPTRGTLISLATDRNSYVESRITNGGNSYLIRHMLDAVSKKGEALVVDNSGKPLLPSGKLPEFDRWVEATFPLPEVFYSSIFTAQAFTGFLGLSKGDRKGVIVRVLGIEHYEDLAKRCRYYLSLLKTGEFAGDKFTAEQLVAITGYARPFVQIEAEITALSGSSRPSVTEAIEILDIQNRKLLAFNSELATARELLTSAQARVKAAEDEKRKIEQDDTTRAGLQERLDAESQALADVVERITNNSGLLDDGENIKAAVIRVGELSNLETHIKQRADLLARLETERESLGTVETRIAENKALLDDATNIRAAVTRSAELVDLIENARLEAERLRSEYDNLKAEAQLHASTRGVAERIVTEAGAQIERIEKRLAKRDEVARARANESEARGKLEEVEALLADLTAEAERLQTLALSTSETRAKNLRTGLEAARDVYQGSEITGDRSTVVGETIIATLSNDDESLDLAKELPGQAANAGGRRAETLIVAEQHRAAVKAIDNLLLLEPDIELAEKELAEAQEKKTTATLLIVSETEAEAALLKPQQQAKAAADEAETQLKTLKAEKVDVDAKTGQSESLAQADALRAELESQQTRHVDSVGRISVELSQVETVLGLAGKSDPDFPGADKVIAELRAEKATVDKKAKLAESLAMSQARIAELELKKVEHDSKIQSLTTQIAAIPKKTAPVIPNTGAEVGAVALAEQSAQSANTAVALATTTLDNARKVTEKIQEIEEERISISNEIADYTLLASSYGPDGLQALEIDAAGPGLSGTINDLLQSCFGTRWTVSVDTTRMSADNKRQLEGCEVIVTDNEKGRIASGESLSGGQKVIIGEAISLALTKLACQRGGIVNPTLVRDESGAALSSKYAPKYMKMLRRALEIIGASRILYMSHNKECQDMADSRIHINNDGTIELS